jgi:hypothetical protein
MNNDAYDRMIDQYLNGQMKPEEAREFQELLKVDPDLKTLFSADMVVDRVLSNDRENLPAERPEAYAHFLGLLATSVPAAQQMAASKSGATSAAKTAAVGKGATGAAAVGKGTILGSILTGGAIKAVIGAVAIVGVAAGTYFGVPALRSGAAGPSAERQIQQTPAPAPALRGTELPSESAAPATSSSSEVSVPASGQESKAEAQPQENASRRAAARAPHASPAEVRTTPMVDVPTATVTVQAEHPDAQRQLQRVLPRVKNDTARMQLKLRSNGKPLD